MGRPVTLFTGQWADMPLENLARKAREFGYQGLELACWGDHFEVDKAIADDRLEPAVPQQATHRLLAKEHLLFIALLFQSLHRLCS